MHRPPSILVFRRLRPQYLRLFLVAVLWFLPALSLAAVDRWSPTGPQGGEIRLLVSAPTEPGRRIAASENAVFLSRLESGPWSFAGEGLEQEDIRSLAFHPADSNLAYAGTRSGLFRTTDLSRTSTAGGRWQLLAGELLGVYISGIAIDPQNPSRIYLGSRQGGVLRSTNGGTSFISINQGLGSQLIDYLLIDPRQPRTLYAGGGFAGLYKTTNGGDSWSEVTPPGIGRAVRTAHLDAQGVLLVGTDDGVRRSDDGGGSWRPANGGIEGSLVFTLSSHPGVPGHLYASVLDFNPRQRLLVRSTDGGTSWTPVANAPNSLGANAFLPRAGVPGNLQIATGRGIFRTVNAGLRWNPFHNGLRAFDAAFLASSEDGKLYFGETFGSIFRGEHASGPWKAVVDAELSEALINGVVGPLQVSPSDPDVVYAGVFNALLRSFDGGESWQEVRGLACLEPVGFSIHPTDSSRVVVGGTFIETECGFEDLPLTYQTFDGGETWQGLESVGRQVAFDPHDGDVIYASRLGLVKSTDGGATFQPADAGLPAGHTFTLALDPVRPGRLFAVDGSGLFRSLDGATTWQTVGDGLPTQEATFRGGITVVIDPQEPDRIYAGLPQVGAFLSVDGGLTFEALSDGLPTTVFNGRLALDGRFPNIVYAGTRGRGIYTISTPRCTADATALCLQGGRFRVEVAWEDPFGNQGMGQARQLTQDTGTFWFFNPANLELAVKVLDGRAFNDHYWVFYGALSDVHYTLTVTDTATGRVASYENPAGQLASRGDTAAFPEAAEGSAANVAATLPAAWPVEALPAAGVGGCAATATRLCLGDGRFQVEVRWRDFEGRTGSGRTLPLTGDTGAFWFFDAANVEVLLKVLDGRAVNGHFWVFYGALSNVEYRITVTDTQTGEVRTYDNPSGQFASRADTRAF